VGFASERIEQANGRSRRQLIDSVAAELRAAEKRST